VGHLFIVEGKMKKRQVQVADVWDDVDDISVKGDASSTRVSHLIHVKVYVKVYAFSVFWTTHYKKAGGILSSLLVRESLYIPQLSLSLALYRDAKSKSPY